MKHKTNTRSSLFLMELIIAILFFSLASAVCLRMFAKSYQLSTDASARNQAVNQTSNVAELIRYDLENGAHTLADAYPDANIIKSVIGNTDTANFNNIKPDSSNGENTNMTNAAAANINVEDMYNGSVIYFDKNWDACSAEQAEYRLIIQAQDSSATLRKYVLSMYSLSATDSSNTASDSDSSVSDAVSSDAANSDAVESDAMKSDNADCIYELPLSIHIAREVGAHE